MKIILFLAIAITLFSCCVFKRPFKHDLIISNNCRIENRIHSKMVYIECDSLMCDLRSNNKVYFIKNNVLIDSINLSNERSYKKTFYLENLETGELISVVKWVLDLQDIPSSPKINE